MHYIKALKRFYSATLRCTTTILQDNYLMIRRIIELAVQNKLVVLLLTLIMAGAGLRSLQNLPLDAVPDITNNQVQVVTNSQHLAAPEMEQFITYPIEMRMSNLPQVIEVRSISRFGLSVVSVIFEESMPLLEARQLVKEQIDIAASDIPAKYGKPELMPITTGLGEVYQYVLSIEDGYEEQFDLIRLRSLQDWVVKRQLAGTPGLVEISSFGGLLKQYEVAVKPDALLEFNLSLNDVVQAVEANNENTGGSYIEKGHEAFYIRTEGRINKLKDLKKIPIAQRGGSSILLQDIAAVRFGHAKRFGAMTMDGKGETVGGITLMLKGANSLETVNNVKEAVKRVQESLPEGVRIEPYLDRADLISRAINTVKNNLIEGGVIVALVLLLMLGNWRAGLIVSSTIPLSLLFAFILMNFFQVPANLMSLGAIDFGIIVDGAIIIIEGVLATLSLHYAGQKLSKDKFNKIVAESAADIYSTAAFGVFIILIVFIPILTLTGVEGKMFRPLALTFSFALLGAFLLAITYVPAMAALLLRRNIPKKRSLAERYMGYLQRGYEKLLSSLLRFSLFIIITAFATFGLSIWGFLQLGQEFIPTLEEGDLAMQMTIQPGSALDESIRSSTKVERILLENFPEVRHVVSKIGTAEVPTDPMAIEEADVMIILSPESEWSTADNRADLVQAMKEKLQVVLGAYFEFTQPIQLRFNELMTGAKTDIAIKIFGDNPDKLRSAAEQAAVLMQNVAGVGDLRVERTEGLQQKIIEFIPEKMAQYGLDVQQLNQIVRAAYAGEKTGVVYEEAARYDLVVRLGKEARSTLDLSRLQTQAASGRPVLLSEVARVVEKEGPMQISHENAQRFISIGINVRARDLASLVAELEGILQKQVKLPTGYYYQIGGEFENLEAAKERLTLAVPLALLLIFVLLYFAFGKLRWALLIFSAIPLATMGGIAALALRGMPFSISAGVGFIALFGVAVLNGIVLLSSYRDLRKENPDSNLREVIIKGSGQRLRPVLMTALTTALGFLPMATSTSTGAEVQQPLATVVVGGLITSTLLTIFVLPPLYLLVEKLFLPSGKSLATIALLLLGGTAFSQDSIYSQAEGWEQLQQSAPWKGLDNQVQQRRALERIGWQPGNFSAQYQLGQIDGADIDQQLVLSQGLGNLFFYRTGQELRKAQRQQQQIQNWEQKRQWKLLYQLRYLQWQYQHSRQQLLDSQRLFWADYLRIAQKRLELGEGDGLTLGLSRQRLQTVDLRQRQIGQKAQKAKSQLLQLLGIVPAGKPTPLQPPLKDTTTMVNDSLLQSWEAELVVNAFKMQQIKQRRQPQLQAGGFVQSLNREGPFSGLQLGVAVPISPQVKPRLEAQALEQNRLRDRRDWEAQQLQNQLQLLQQQAALMQAQLREQTDLLRNWEANLELARQQVEVGSLNYFNYYQLLDQRFELQEDLLQSQKEAWSIYYQIQFLTRVD